MNKLKNKKCIPCSGNIPPLRIEDKKAFKEQVSEGWNFSEDNKKIMLKLKFKDFSSSLRLANLVGELAETEWHHPEITLGYGYLHIEIWTHKIGDLVESDFIFAAKVDEIIRSFK